LTWMKETLDFSFWQKRKFLQWYLLFISISTRYIIKFAIYLFSDCLLWLPCVSLIRVTSPR
jgi:hypothetical protein